MSIEELSVLRRIAEKAIEFSKCDDIWIDGIDAGNKYNELKLLLEAWRVKYSLHQPIWRR